MGLRTFALWVPRAYEGDRIFSEAGPLNRDDCLAAFRLLRRRLAESGLDCATHDVCRASGKVPSTVLFLDMPAVPVAEALGSWAGRAEPWLLLQEPPTIIPANWDLRLHAQFSRVFTWNDDLVDGRKYFKINYAGALPRKVPRDQAAREKLCVMIAGNHRSSCPGELYSKRAEAVRWFERNRPGDFDLYGRGWDEFPFTGPRLVRALNRLKPLRRLLAPHFPSWRGPVEQKKTVLGKYKFAICYENNCDMPGYISEKIFDCFASGCLPVYWGAPNIAGHVPAECFLDKREYPSYAALYERMRAMTDAETRSRLDAIDAFLAGDKGYRFSAECFAATLAAAAAQGGGRE